jgi:uncharacterized membrane protein YdbT with pleckstrin-like domain
MAKYHFDGQEPEEKILLMLRRHPLILIYNVSPLFIAIIIAIIVYIILPLVYDTLAQDPWKTLWDLLAVATMMFVWVAFFIIFIDYYLDVWVVTAQRIVNIEQRGLFRREIATLDLTKIQDVSMTQEGLIPTVLNYGDVTIQTAGSFPHFVFKQVRNPSGIKDVIINAAEEITKNLSKSSANYQQTKNNDAQKSLDDANFDFK